MLTMEDQMRELCARALNIPSSSLDTSKSFLALGGDSLSALRVMSGCTGLGLAVTVADILRCGSISDMWTNGGINAVHDSVSERTTTPLQDSFLRMNTLHITSINVAEDASPYDVFMTLGAVVKKHVLLQTHLPLPGGNLLRSTDDESAFHFTLGSITYVENELEVDLSDLIDGVSLENGPTFGATLFSVERKPQSQRLVLAGHRAFIETKTWRVVVDHVRNALRESGCNVDVENKLLTNAISRGIVQLQQSMGNVAQLTISSKTVSRLLLPEVHRVLRTDMVDILHAAALSALAGLNLEDKFVDVRMVRPSASTASSEHLLWHLIMEKTRVGESDMTLLVRTVKDATRGFSATAEDGGNTLMQPPQSQTLGDLIGNFTILIDFSEVLTPQVLDRAMGIPARLWRPQPHPGKGIICCHAAFDAAGNIKLTTTSSQAWDETRFQHRFDDALQKVLNEFTMASQSGQPVPTISDLGWPYKSYAALERSIEKVLSRLCSNPIQDIEKIIPCSRMQQDLLTSQQVDSRRYTCAFLLKFIGRGAVVLDPMRLVSSWAEVVKRHETLRTVFINEWESREGGFAGVVLKEVQPEFHILEGEAHRSQPPFNSHDVVPFDTAKPPHRLYLVKGAGQAIYLRLDMSHALMDGQSAEIILEDLYLAYQGAPYTHKPLPYEQFVLHEQNLRDADTSTYWTDYLRGAEPTNVPSAAGTNTNAASYCFHFPLDKLTLSRFCTTSGVTLSSICQLSWALVLKTITGSDTVVFSYVTSGRDYHLEGIHSTIGALVKSLVCRVNFTRDAPVGGLLQKIVLDLVEGLQHQHLDLPEVDGTGATGSARKWGNTTMSFRHGTVAHGWAERGVEVQIEDVINPVDYDIRLNVEAAGDGLDIDLGYWAQSMQGDVEMMGRLFQKAVTEIVDSMGKSVGDIQLQTQEDLAMIQSWNSSRLPPLSTCCIQDLVRNRSQAMSKDAIAISSWDGEVTYHELWEQVTKVAWHLSRLGVGPEAKVGVCMDKSRWAVICMLGILAAGGVVVPLGTEHPVARIERIIKETEIRVIIMDQAQSDRLGVLAEHAVVPSTSWLNSLPKVSLVPHELLTPQNAAWIIFTSGSTGVPKGVVLEHGPLLTSLLEQGPRYGIGPGTRVIQFASYTFDVSISDILVTLLHGGTVCIMSEYDRMNRLAQAMSELEVTFGNLTPTVVQLLTPEAVPSLKTILVGGEPLTASIVRSWSQHVSVLNSYGMSEVSIHSAVSKPISHISDRDIIGHPIAAHFWVVDLDDHHRLVPVGVAGELLLESPSLAREYLCDPEKTAASFITDTKWALQFGLQGRRFYRTGDLVRQNSDGSLRILGRRDAQVKIRGQRVEVGEIEHHILQHPDVEEAAVVYAKQGRFADKLIAFWSLREQSSSFQGDIVRVAETTSATHQREQVKRILQDKVMPYMLPSLWVQVEAVPRNPSGKIDRRQLLRWLSSVDASSLQNDQGPSQETVEAMEKSMTLVERQIRQVWSQVLNVPLTKVMIHHSFTSLGGDSITAMQVVTNCRRLHISLSVKKVLQCQSITQLALQAGDGEGSGDRLDLSVVSSTPFPLSPIQELYLRTRTANGLQAKGEHRFNQSVLLRVRRPASIQALSRALEVVVVKHAMLRARFSGDSTTGWTQNIPDQVIGSYQLAHHTVSSRDQLLKIILSAQGSMNLQRGPVFAVHAFAFQETQLLFLIAHHLVVDLVSWRIILNDLADILENRLLPGHNSASFSSWCNRQEGELYCSSLDTTSVLPYQVPDPDWAYWKLNPDACVAANSLEQPVWLDEDVTSALFSEKGNRALSTEPVEILLSALLFSFGRVFPDRTLPAVFNEGHGRETDDGIDLSMTVGWFTTITPLALPQSALSYDAIETLRCVKDTRRRVPGRGMPYFTSRFRTESGRQIFKSHDYPEIVFNYQGRYQQLEREDGLFQVEREMGSLPASIGARTKTSAVFDINSAVVDGKACTTFKFDASIAHKDRIYQWLDQFQQSLKTILGQLMNMEPVVTVSDFSQSELLSEADVIKLQNHDLPALGVCGGLAAVEDIYPCSPLQRGILISQAKDPKAYQIRQVYAFRTRECRAVSMSALAEAWEKVVNRHAVLRTMIVETSSTVDPYHQIVLKSWTASISLITESDATDKIDLARLERRDHRPGHRLTLFHTQQGVRAILDVDHALCDASSVQLIVRDWLCAYDDVLPPEPSALYGDYIAHVRSQLDQKSLCYWTQLLQDTRPCHVEPLISQRATHGSVKMSTARITDITALRTLSREHGITLANMVQLAWALTLGTYTGSDQACFGYLRSGRDAPVKGIEDLVGPLINMTPSYVSLDRQSTIIDALKQVQDQFLEGLDHQYTPLSSIQHALRLPEKGLFNTGISFMQGHSTFAVTRGQSIEAEAVCADDNMDYDLALGVEASEEVIGFGLQWRTVFSDEAAADKLLHTFSSFLQTLAKYPQKKLGLVSLISDEDKAQISRWNATLPPSKALCLHDLVQSRCQDTPNALAVDAWDGQLTYGELWTCALRAAVYLGGLGVGREVKVGISMEKSRWAVVSMLAVLVAGGVVVPLGTEHPIARVERIIRDTRMTVILGDGAQAQCLAESCSVITANETWFTSLCDTDTNISMDADLPRVSPNDAAWIIYTSGSTGDPKGVVLEHSSLSTSILAQGRTFSIHPQTRTLQFSSFTFDVSIGDIFITLSYGGCVCLITEHDRLNGLSVAMASKSTTFVQLTPTVAQLIDPKTVPTMELLVLGGEVAKPEVIETWSRHVSVLVAYGPTECSIASSYSNPLTHPVPSIGLPMTGCFWVTEVSGPNRLVPIGVTGELLLEGPLLAREYLNHPVKTAESFIVDPPWVDQITVSRDTYPRRFYRTGDLVKQNTDGSLTYVGRRDTQVKIRGQRVDLEEIEVCITRSLSQVERVVVEVIPSSSKSHILLAAAMDFKAGSLQAPCPSELSQHLVQASPLLRSLIKDLQKSLATLLPHYMIPAAYVPMVRLPLGASGKLDRRAVRDLLTRTPDEYIQDILSAETDDAEDPVNMSATQCTLRDLAADALGVGQDNIKLSDHFFQRGGDSVSAMRLVAEARARSLSLSVSDIFRHPRIVDLARVVDQQTDKASSQREALFDDPSPFSLWSPEENGKELGLQAISEQCEISVAEIEDVYPCTPLQEGLMAISTQQSPSPYLAQRVFRLGREVHMSRFVSSWTKISEVFPIMRTRIVPSAQGCLQVLTNQPVRCIQSSQSLDTYLAADRMIPIAYGKPLTRFALVQSSDQDSFFVWTSHHSTYDGWSLGKIAETLRTIYADVTEGFTHAPPPPFTRFIAYLQHIKQDAIKAFWQKELQDIESIPAFPEMLRDARHRPNVTARMVHTLRTPDQQRQGEATVSTILRAAWALVVAHWTSDDDVLFAVTTSGRGAPLPGVLDIVAPTIATSPARIQIDRTLSLEKFLEGVQRQAADIMPYEHAGLHNIRRYISSGLDLGHLFLVQAPTERETRDFIEIPGVQVLDIQAEGFHTYPLVVECFLSKDGDITVEAKFDEGVVSQSQMTRVLSHFEHVFGQLVSLGGTCPLEHISILSQQDADVVRTWRATPPSALETCLHDLVQKTYEARPGALAVHAWDGHLTYAELWNQSTQIANYLVGMGVGPEIKVGICMSKSKWAPVCMLAVLRAGGVVTPLGVQFPMTRIENMIEDTEMSVILVDSSQKDRLRGVVPHLLVVDDNLLSTLPAAQLSANPVKHTNAAWIIYTSGSTGTPKGVVLEHNALSLSVYAHGAKFAVKESTRMLQFAAHTFDVCISETFATLAYGGCLCIPSEAERMNNLAGAIASMGVNFAQLTSTVAQLLDPDTAPSIKSIVLMGEAVKPAVVSTWGSYATVISAYGPSESCIHASYSPPLVDSRDALVIGHPIAGCFWVVNAHDSDTLCPVGMNLVGELLLEGPLLARGYLNDTDKTVSSFITDPKWCTQLGLSPGRRFYRTGDLVRQHVDGSLTYVGRRDTQVKIRGQRVETGEIENWISRVLPDVHMVAVDVIRRGAGDQLLLSAAIEFKPSFSRLTGVAHAGLIPPSDRLVSIFQSLRIKLLEVLPAYMVPNAYIPMTKLPLNASGKLDRREVHRILMSEDPQVLMQYNPRKGHSSADQVEFPPVAVTLRSLLAGLLDMEETEIHGDEDIFQLGSDSVTAMKLVTLARSRGIFLGVTDIFTSPTILGMAGLVKTSDDDGPVYEPFSLLGIDPSSIADYLEQEISPLVSIPRTNISDTLPVTDVQAYSIVTSVMENQMELRYFKWVANAAANVSFLKACLVKLVEFVEPLRTAYVLNRGALLQVVLKNWVPDISSHEINGPIEMFAHNLVKNNLHQPTRFGTPMFCASIVNRKDQPQHWILFRLNHAMYDGASLPKIWSTLHDIYSGRKPQSYPGMSSFLADISLQTPKKTYTYWEEHLKGSAMLSLSSAGPRRQLPSPIAKATPPPTLKVGLFSKGSFTPAIYIKSAWAIVLSAYTNEQDLIMGQVVSGRESVSGSAADSLGCCINMVPFRARLPHGTRIDEMLDRMRKDQVASVAHSTLGFRTIFRECARWPANTRFTTTFNHLNNPPRSLQASTQHEEQEYDISPAGTELFSMADLALTSIQWGDEISLDLGYAKDRIEGKVAMEILQQVRNVVEMLVDEPHGLVSDIVATTPWQGTAHSMDDHTESVAGQPGTTNTSRHFGRNGDVKVQEQGSRALFGGDIVDAAVLGDQLGREGVQISIEEVLGDQDV